MIWGEQIIEIADDWKGDHRQDRNGNAVHNKENVLRSKLRIEARQWVMARLDPQLWGDRQQIDLKHDWSHLSEAERVRKAMAMLDVAEELVNRPTLIEATPIRYDSTDGDELAEAERRHRRLEDLGQGDPEGRIGR